MKPLIDLPEQKASSRGRPRVLLVDDDPEYVDRCRSELERDGYLVDVAHDGEMALIAAHRQVPDLIVLAMLLPGIGGVEVLETLRSSERTRAVPVLILSSSVERSLVERSRELGAVDYLVKNLIGPADLGEQVGRWINSRELRHG